MSRDLNCTIVVGLFYIMLFFSPYLHARTAIKMFDGMNSLLILLLFVLKRIANMYKSNNITGELFLELDQ